MTYIRLKTVSTDCKCTHLFAVIDRKEVLKCRQEAGKMWALIRISQAVTWLQLNKKQTAGRNEAHSTRKWWWIHQYGREQLLGWSLRASSHAHMISAECEVMMSLHMISFVGTLISFWLMLRFLEAYSWSCLSTSGETPLCSSIHLIETQVIKWVSRLQTEAMRGEKDDCVSSSLMQFQSSTAEWSNKDGKKKLSSQTSEGFWWLKHASTEPQNPSSNSNLLL